MRDRKRAFWLAGTLAASAPLGVLSLPASAQTIEANKIIYTHYDGITNDLLTAGLGKTGLGNPTPPPVSAVPTAEELRRLAIYNNYRALVDPTPGGGYGTLYGPNVTADGQVTTSEGLIAGDEYIAFDNKGGPRKNVTLLVQIPASYDPKNGCIVTAPSSGSRGIYGAIATAGEWGLKHGCAVAYTDKGTGTGAHDLDNDTVNLIRGELAPASVASNDSIFTAPLNRNERVAFTTANPFRFAFKHAHSEQNPEKDWGQNVLDSIKFAFSVLKQKFGENAVSRKNTIVIASSVSNGGGASVRAVEEDEEGLIDGLAVGEPNVNPVFSSKFSIQQGGQPALSAHSKPLIDYITLVNVYQGCANLAPENILAPLNLAPSPARCASLAAKGLLKSATTAAQATEAQKIINDFGILTEQNLVQPGYWFASVSRSIAVTYANAYGRFSVTDNLCNFSFASTPAGIPAPLAGDLEGSIFGTSNGIPPTAGVSLINNVAPGGPQEDRISTADQNLDGALCLRSLAIGKDAVTNEPLIGTQAEFARRIENGVDQILASGRLHKVPAIFVTGRSDGILPPNFASRAYFGLNNVVEGKDSNLHYYEVTNAHHLDAFNAIPGYDALFIPLHRYYLQALDLMYAHLRNQKPLPPSQVIHTTSRGPGTPPPPVTLANVPPILDNPPANALITFSGEKVRIPD